MVDQRKFRRTTPGTLPVSQTSVQAVPHVGRVTKVTNDGVMVVIAALTGLELGPAPWCVGGYDTLTEARTAGFCPRVGDQVLLLFAGVGVEESVVASWWR